MGAAAGCLHTVLVLEDGSLRPAVRLSVVVGRLAARHWREPVLSRVLGSGLAAVRWLAALLGSGLVRWPIGGPRLGRWRPRPEVVVLVGTLVSAHARAGARADTDAPTHAGATRSRLASASALARPSAADAQTSGPHTTTGASLTRSGRGSERGVFLPLRVLAVGKCHYSFSLFLFLFLFLFVTQHAACTRTGSRRRPVGM